MILTSRPRPASQASEAQAPSEEDPRTDPDTDPITDCGDELFTSEDSENLASPMHTHSPSQIRNADRSLWQFVTHTQGMLDVQKRPSLKLLPAQVMAQPKHASGSRNPGSDRASQLTDEFKAFLALPGSGSFLLLEEGGINHSLSIRSMILPLQQAWQRYFADPDQQARPAYLPILVRGHAEDDNYRSLWNILGRIMQRHGLQTGTVQLLAFAEAYDQIHMEPARREHPGNLAQDLGLPSGAKLVITCHPDSVGRGNLYNRFAFESNLQVRRCLPLSQDQILGCLNEKMEGDAQGLAPLKEALQASPKLLSLLGNPALLQLVCDSWSSLRQQDLSQLTRAKICASYLDACVAGKGELRREFGRHFQGQQALQAPPAEAAVVPRLVFEYCIAEQLLDYAGKDAEHISESRLQSRLEEIQTFFPIALLLLPEQINAPLWQTEPCSQSCRKNRIRLLQAIAEVSRQRQKFGQARELHLLSLAILQKAGESDPVETALPYMQIGIVFMKQGKSREAKTHFLTAMQRLDTPRDRQALGLERAICHENLAAIFMAGNDGWGAQEHYSRALAIRKRMQGDLHPDTLTTCRNHALMLLHLGKRDSAMHALREVMEAREKSLGLEHVDTAQSCNDMAELLAHEDKFEQALALHHKALAIQAKVLGAFHTDTAITRNSIAMVLNVQGKHAQALGWIRQALLIQEQAFGVDDLDTAASYSKLASVLVAQAQPEPALEICDKALQAFLAIQGPDHPCTLRCQTQRGAILLDLHRTDEALEILAQSRKLQAKAVGPTHQDCATTSYHLASALARKGRLSEALAHLRSGLEILEENISPGHSSTAKFHGCIAGLLRKQGKLHEALKSYKTALAIAETAGGLAPIDLLGIHHAVGLIWLSLGRHGEALDCQFKALSIGARHLGSRHLQTVLVYVSLGQTLHALRHYEEARRFYLAALKTWEQSSPNPLWSAELCHKLGRTLEAQGRTKQALAYYRKALALAPDAQAPAAAEYRQRITALSASISRRSS